jgi:hypothetical protein
LSNIEKQQFIFFVGVDFGAEIKIKTLKFIVQRKYFKNKSFILAFIQALVENY